MLLFFHAVLGFIVIGLMKTSAYCSAVVKTIEEKKIHLTIDF